MTSLRVVNGWKVATVALTVTVAAIAGVYVGHLTASQANRPVTHSTIASPVASVRPSMSPRASVRPSPGRVASVRPSASPTALPTAMPVLFVAGSYSGTYPAKIFISESGSSYITDIVWSTWTSSEAIGYGEHGIDGCVPDCAAGKYTYYPDTIVLSDPIFETSHLWSKMSETYNGQSVYYSLCQCANGSWPLAAS